MTTRTSKKPTKAELKARGIHNSWNFCEAGSGRLFLDYQARGTACGRAWQVIGLKFHTDPGSQWYNYGRKTFRVGSQTDAALAEDKVWTGEKYGIESWVRDPFGGWQDKQVYDKVVGNG